MFELKKFHFASDRFNRDELTTRAVAADSVENFRAHENKDPPKMDENQTSHNK